MTVEALFPPAVVVFTVSNLAAMGLELDARASLRYLRSARLVLLTVLWGWVVGPALAWSITRVVPLAEGHAAGLLLISMAPTAPFFPLMVRLARGDMAFAAAFMLLATLGTVVFLPLLVPLMIPGLTVEVLALARPLVVMVLLPLLVGIAVGVYAPRAAARLSPVVKRIGGISLLLTLVFTLILHGRDMLGAVGSLAPGAQVSFLGALAAVAYTAGFGLQQRQRSAIALGMCTRNIAAVFVAYFGIESPPPGLLVMIVLVVPLAALVALAAARLFSAGAEETAAVGARRAPPRGQA